MRPWLIGCVLLAMSGTAVADDAHQVVFAGGPEVALMASSNSELPEAQTGYFLRVAWTPGIPSYTTAARGYVWRTGPSAELNLRRGQLEDRRYYGGTVGLRYDIAFSQRRMGLLQVSGRGGFYFAGRVGLIYSGSRPDAVCCTIQDGDTAASDGGMSPAIPDDTQRTVLLAAGTYILLGGSGLRLGTEIAAFGIEPRYTTSDRYYGGLVRISLGFGLGASH